jgi:hypothetical protein
MYSWFERENTDPFEMSGDSSLSENPSQKNFSKPKLETGMGEPTNKYANECILSESDEEPPGLVPETPTEYGSGTDSEEDEEEYQFRINRLETQDLREDSISKADRIRYDSIRGQPEGQDAQLRLRSVAIQRIAIMLAVKLLQSMSTRLIANDVVKLCRDHRLVDISGLKGIR